MPSAWTTTLPQGASRIRLLPQTLQDRWNNIQNGEVPSAKWQLARRAGNPGTIASSGQIFTKDGGAGTSELYYKDDSGNTTQMTTAGGVGALTQTVLTNNIAMKPGATQINNPQQAFCCAFGNFTGQTSNGTYAPDAGSFNMLSYQRIGTGKYIVTMNFTATGIFSYTPVVSARKIGTSSMWTAFVTDQTTTTFRVEIVRSVISGLVSSSYDDGDFSVAIFGAFT